MKILKLVLGIAGVVLIVFGLYTLLMPNGGLFIDLSDSFKGHRSTSQSWGMICLGSLALLAVVFSKNRK